MWNERVVCVCNSSGLVFVWHDGALVSFRCGALIFVAVFLFVVCVLLAVLYHFRKLKRIAVEQEAMTIVTNIANKTKISKQEEKLAVAVLGCIFDETLEISSPSPGESVSQG